VQAGGQVRRGWPAREAHARATAETFRRGTTGERTPERFFRVKQRITAAISRALAYAPYADLVWFETSRPDLEEAREFATEIRRHHPAKLLAYNCSPSFNWKRSLKGEELSGFQENLAAMGYKFQFVTLSAFHALNSSIFSLARDYQKRGMAAYAELQAREFEDEESGYEATKHQEFVGARYFDDVTQVAMEGLSSTLAMEGSTEREQF